MSKLSQPFRRGLAAGAAVLVLGSAAVGIASAQAQPAPPTGQAAPPAGYQAFIDALAKRLNTTSANLQTAITQARSDAGLPAGGGFGGGPGRGGPRGRGGPGGDLNAAATALNITPQQLRTELQGKSLADVAKAHGKTEADMVTALQTAANARIDAAVTAGRVTAADAATQKTQIDARIAQMVTQVVPQGGPAGQGGPGGPGGMRGRGPGGPRGFGGPGGDLNAAATALNITPQQLQTELNGKSLADVAKDHGKTGADMVAALQTAAHARIQAAVTAGRLTAAQAATATTNVDQRIEQQVNQVRQQRTPGRPAGGKDQQPAV
jgi:hypothetical protein